MMSRVRVFLKALSITAVAVTLPLGLTACPSSPAGGSVDVVVQLDFNDKIEGKTRPIAGVPVEVWTNGGGGWGKDKTGTTDAHGHYTTKLPFRNKNVEYALRILPKNNAMECCSGWAPAGFSNLHPWIEPGDETGTPIHVKVASSKEDVGFSHVFSGVWGSIFNTLDAARYAATFARENHEDRDSDHLGVEGLGLAGSGPNDLSWTDPVMQTMNLTPGDRWEDLTVLHEYGHWVQAQISTLAWIVSTHSGCTPGRFVVIGGNGNIVSDHSSGLGVSDLERGQHAWLEGFADWFAEYVYARYPNAFQAHTSSLESASCTEAGPTPDGDRFENHVAAFLWDLTDPIGNGEQWDQDCCLDRARVILNVVEQEMDRPGHWPTIADFTDALVSRSAVYYTNSGDDIADKNRVSWLVIN